MMSNEVTLRREVFKSDAFKIIDWLNDDEVTKYLNENQNVSRDIEQAMDRINMPILTHLFNQNGSFFMITNEDESIGFLRLVFKSNASEMVIVIGDRENWGKGLGSHAIFEGLKQAFFEWRVDKVIAKIRINNERSKNAFKKVGFIKDKELEREVQYSISMDEFLKRAA